MTCFLSLEKLRDFIFSDDIMSVTLSMVELSLRNDRHSLSSMECLQLFKKVAPVFNSSDEIAVKVYQDIIFGYVNRLSDFGSDWIEYITMTYTKYDRYLKWFRPEFIAKILEAVDKRIVDRDTDDNVSPNVRCTLVKASASDFKLYTAALEALIQSGPMAFDILLNYVANWRKHHANIERYMNTYSPQDIPDFADYDNKLIDFWEKWIPKYGIKDPGYMMKYASVCTGKNYANAKKFGKYGFIAYKAVNWDNTSVMYPCMTYRVGEHYQMVSDYDLRNENSYGLSAWTPIEALNFSNTKLLEVFIPYSALTYVNFLDFKVRASEFYVINEIKHNKND